MQTTKERSDGLRHDLFTPLTAILGFSAHLLAKGELLPNQREAVAQILAAGTRLVDLIDERIDKPAWEPA
jgi:signal transduction histidine kinase